jgi:hypothetical protein
MSNIEIKEQIEENGSVTGSVSSAGFTLTFEIAKECMADNTLDVLSEVKTALSHAILQEIELTRNN